MVSAADVALQRAADRARRLADRIASDTSYAPQLRTPPSAGATSTASTIPATDEAARENARRGCAEARRMAERTHQGPVVRVDGVPVVPEVVATPPDKIRRRDTMPLSNPSAPKEACAGMQAPSCGEAAASLTASVPISRSQKKKCKRSNKKKKQATAVKGPTASEPCPAPLGNEAALHTSNGVSGHGGQENGAAPTESVGDTDMPPADVPAQLTDAKTTSTEENNEAANVSSGTKDGSCSRSEPSSNKPTASKAAPKPKAQVKAEESTTPSVRQRVEGEPITHAEAVKRSHSDSFRRACSSVQQTPSACPPVEPQTNGDLPSPLHDSQAEEPSAAADMMEADTDQQKTQQKDGTTPSEPAGSEHDEPDGDDDEEYNEEEEEEEEPAEPGHEEKEKEEMGKTKKDAPSTVSTVEGKDKEPKKKKEKTPEQKAAHARYMRFSRSLSSKFTPEAIRKAGASSKYCTEKLQILMDEWLSCQGAWTKIAFYQRVMEKRSMSQRGARVWLTQHQIAEKYKSELIASRICEQKRSDPELFRTQTKLHPDDPSEEMRLFLVWDSDVIAEQTDHVVESLFESIDDGLESDDASEGDKKSAKKNKKSKKKRKRSSSSESSEESSSSVSEEKGKKKRKGKKGGKRGKKRGKKGGKSKKKESSERKKERLQKEKEQMEKEEAREKAKAEKEVLNKGKKTLSTLNDKIVDACSKEKIVSAMSPELKKAIWNQLSKKKNALCDLRGQIQTNIDNVEKLDPLCETAKTLISEYKDLLIRVNLAK